MIVTVLLAAWALRWVILALLVLCLLAVVHTAVRAPLDTDVWPDLTDEERADL